jgi:hypothetical protein
MSGGPFKKGQSGNPSGRKPGTRNRATLLALAAMEGELDAIVRSIIEAAKKGDMTAARLVVDKLVPPAKDLPLQIDLPQASDISGCLKAQTIVLNEVAAGNLLPGEGQVLSALIENQRRSLETQQMEQRLKTIEEKLGVKP